MRLNSICYFNFPSLIQSLLRKFSSTNLKKLGIYLSCWIIPAPKAKTFSLFLSHQNLGMLKLWPIYVKLWQMHMSYWNFHQTHPFRVKSRIGDLGYAYRIRRHKNNSRNMLRFKARVTIYEVCVVLCGRRRNQDFLNIYYSE